MRAMARMETHDPSLKKSNTLLLEPNREALIKLQFDPSLAYARRETVEPSFDASNTDNMFPRRVIWYTDIVLPNR
jgi:hypothetical protein